MRLTKSAARSDWAATFPNSNLSAIELCWALPFGPDTAAPSLLPDTQRSPRKSLETVVLRALQRPPCLVSFSGGRDSSVVLGVAAHVARREGLPDPIPFTHRFVNAPESQETSWQELIVWHLRLDDWEIRSWDAELDSVGPYAQRTLRQLGVTSPSNQHFLLPVIDRARGGTVLTGSDGDEIFGLRNRPVATRFLYGPHPRSWRDVRGFAAGLLPLRVRSAMAYREHGLTYPWIRPEPLAEINKRLARWMQAIPLRYDRALLDWLWPSRVTQNYRAQVAALGCAHNVDVEHPFSSPEFLTSFAGDVGAAGPAGRARGLRALAGDLLPDALFSRTTKASFDQAFTTVGTRSFAEAWDGKTFDSALIDPDVLRAEWLKPHPEPHSLGLLQAAWLAQSGGVQDEGERTLDVGNITGADEGEHRNRGRA